MQGLALDLQGTVLAGRAAAVDFVTAKVDALIPVAVVDPDFAHSLARGVVGEVDSASAAEVSVVHLVRVVPRDGREVRHRGHVAVVVVRVGARAEISVASRGEAVRPVRVRVRARPLVLAAEREAMAHLSDVANLVVGVLLPVASKTARVVRMGDGVNRQAELVKLSIDQGWMFAPLGSDEPVERVVGEGGVG